MLILDRSFSHLSRAEFRDENYGWRRGVGRNSGGPRREQNQQFTCFGWLIVRLINNFWARPAGSRYSRRSRGLRKLINFLIRVEKDGARLLFQKRTYNFLGRADAFYFTRKRAFLSRTDTLLGAPIFPKLISRMCPVTRAKVLRAARRPRG